MTWPSCLMPWSSSPSSDEVEIVSTRGPDGMLKDENGGGGICVMDVSAGLLVKCEYLR